jgi:hypothetical protein
MCIHHHANEIGPRMEGYVQGRRVAGGVASVGGDIGDPRKVLV